MGFLGVYRAIYNYAPQGEGELEITEGDLLFVLEKSTEDDWWKAKKKAASDEDDEPEGLIPNNYVEEAKPISKAKALYDYTKQTDEEISFPEEAHLDVYDDSDPDWTLVGHNGQYGFAPTIYTEKISASSNSVVAAPAMPTRHRAPSPVPTPESDDFDDSPLPSPTQNPAKALAGIIAQRTGGGAPAPAPVAREPPSPALPSRPPAPAQYTPEESEEEAPPPMPRRPRSEVQHQEAYRAASPPRNRAAQNRYDDDVDLRSPGAYKLYHVHEMVKSMGKKKKMPTVLGIDLARGQISMAPSKGTQQEWSGEKLSHYSIEGKHVFLELVRPSKSVDLHAGTKDTANEITSLLGDLAGTVRAEGLREVLAAASGAPSGQKKGHMLYEHMAQGDDEVSVAAGDEVVVLDDTKSDDWWMVRRIKTGKEGVVPASYVEVTDILPVRDNSGSYRDVNHARSTVEQNRREEERITREAAQKHRQSRDSRFMDDGVGASLPARSSSLARGEQDRSQKQSSRKSTSGMPNPANVRMWSDRTGKFKVEAEFVGLRDGKIHIWKTNGVRIAVEVGKMSVADLEYVENVTGTSLDNDKPLADIKRRNTQRERERQPERDTNGISATQEPTYDWFDFFLASGVNPQICERYAQVFARDQMGEEILPEVTPALLRTLGLKEGDIIRVMKHLDTKFGRTNGTPTEGEANGGLFSGPGGELKNNTRKRPEPTTQTSNVVDADALRQKPAKDDDDIPPPAPPKDVGFDDDAWSVKPSKSPAAQSASATISPAPVAAAAAPPPPKPQAPALTGSMGELSLLSAPLQPTPTGPPPQPVQTQATAPPSQPARPTADAQFFDKLGAPAPQNILSQPTGRQRPVAPPLIASNPALAPPPQRSSSAPGFQYQQQSPFGVPAPLTAQMTGYQQPMQTGYQAPPGQSLQSLQQQQQMQPYQQQNGFAPQQTGYQGMVQPQMTGFYPQQQQQGPYQPLQMQPTASPFADPPRQPFQPTPSQFGSTNGMLPPALTPVRTGYTNPALQPQQTGYGQQWPRQQQQQQQQPQQSFLLPGQQLPPGMTLNANGALVPQQTGFGQQQQQTGFGQPQQTGFGQQQSGFGQPQQTGFGQPQQTGFNQAPAQLVQQKTGPAPPVRFGTTGIKPLVATPTGRRANLGNATPQNPFGF